MGVGFGLEEELRAGLKSGVRVGVKAGLKVGVGAGLRAVLVCHGCVEWLQGMKNL